MKTNCFCRHLVTRILTDIGHKDAPVISSSHRVRRDLSVTEAEPVNSAHRRARRSIADMAPPSPSNEPPLLRVKRLGEEEEEELTGGLLRKKRINTMANAAMEELNHGSRRRQRREILIDQILEYMRE